MKSKPDKLKVPSLEAVRKYLNGEKVDAETAAFGRKVEKFYAQYVSKHKGSKLKELVEEALAAGASREEVLERAVKAGYLEGCTDDIVREILGEEEKETPMEVVRVLAFAESMSGEQAGEHLYEAYLLAEAWDAAERWWNNRRSSSPLGKKPLV